MNKTKRIKILRNPIFVEGEFAGAGSVVDVPAHIAQFRINCGDAVETDEKPVLTHAKAIEQATNPGPARAEQAVTRK